MRRKMVFVVSVVLAMSLMTGCGAKGETEVSETVVTEASEETEAVSEEVTEEISDEATEEDTESADGEAEEATSSDGEYNYGEYTYTGDDNVMDAISFWICDELAKGYEAADVGIPTMIEVARDDSNPDDIKVWGDFWYNTYNLNGDTFETQAGGNYPGCFHVKTVDSGCGYQVTDFEMVADGANFDSSAKEIFGDNYDAFMDVYSNDEVWKDETKNSIAGYVTSHNVPATKYQDYGWDPVELFDD